MAISYAGKPAHELLVDLTRLEREYYERCPDLADLNQLVSFGTGGARRCTLIHRSAHSSHYAGHLLSAKSGHRRPLHGKDTHACPSRPAHRLEVLAANAVETIIQQDDGVTPTPVISWNIRYNRDRTRHSPTALSSRPPLTRAGRRFQKYNHPRRPLTSTSPRVEQRHDLLRAKPASNVCPLDRHQGRRHTSKTSWCRMLRICGTSSIWTSSAPPTSRWGGPTGGATGRVGADRPLSPGHCRRERSSTPRSRSRRSIMMGYMDPQPVSPWPGWWGQGSVSRRLRERSGPDRHGIVVLSVGLMNPNHFLAVAIRYLLTHRQ